MIKIMADKSIILGFNLFLTLNSIICDIYIFIAAKNLRTEEIKKDATLIKLKTKVQGRNKDISNDSSLITSYDDSENDSVKPLSISKPRKLQNKGNSVIQFNKLPTFKMAQGRI